MTRAMLGRLNHVAIAVPDLDAAASLYRGRLGTSVSAPVPLPSHGVTTIFVDLPNTRIELISPLGDASPISGFLERNPAGGIHHICFEVSDLAEAVRQLTTRGSRVLNGGKPEIGAHGKPVVFLHPKDFLGTLIELEEASA